MKGEWGRVYKTEITVHPLAISRASKERQSTSSNVSLLEHFSHGTEDLG